MASVAIIFRKDKLNKKGKAPIHLRIIKHRKVRYISTGIILEAKLWNDKLKRIKPSHPNSQRLNSFLAHKFTELQDQVFEFETHSKSLSTSQLKDKVMGKKPIDFITFAEEALKDYLSANKVSTYAKNKSVVNKLKDYRKGKSLSFQDITPRFLVQYERYLVEEMGNKINTVQNSMNFFRKLFNDAIKQDLVELHQNPFNRYTIKSEKGQKTFLTDPELMAIENLSLTSGSRMELHRDMFVFSSYSGGIRVSDTLLLQWDHFDGTHIHVSIHKTKGQISIKLPTKALEIITHYQSLRAAGQNFVFPMLDSDLDLNNPWDVDAAISSANSYINKNLKKIAKRAGVKKNVSFHISRHTWATRALQKGIGIETVSKLLGHANIRDTLIYAKIVGKGLDEAMGRFDE